MSGGVKFTLACGVVRVLLENIHGRRLSTGAVVGVGCRDGMLCVVGRCWRDRCRNESFGQVWGNGRFWNDENRQNGQIVKIKDGFRKPFEISEEIRI